MNPKPVLLFLSKVYLKSVKSSERINFCQVSLNPGILEVCTRLLLQKFRAKARAALHGSQGQGYCLPKELEVYVDWSIHEKLSGLNFGRYFLTEFSSPAVENSPQLCVTIRIIRSGGLASLFLRGETESVLRVISSSRNGSELKRPMAHKVCKRTKIHIRVLQKPGNKRLMCVNGGQKSSSSNLLSFMGSPIFTRPNSKFLAEAIAAAEKIPI